MKIVHIVSRDKFTNGYINFFEDRINHTSKYVIIRDRKDIDVKIDERRTRCIYFIRSYSTLRFNNKIMSLLKDSDLIIVSGLFEMNYGVAFLPQKCMDKLYIQVWGREFYGIEKKSIIHFRYNISKYCKLSTFKRCQGIIFLIDGEDSKFTNITGIVPNYYIAPMPEDYLDLENADCISLKLMRENNNGGIIKILLGNSATKSNRHIESLEFLSKFKNYSMEVYVPLSYGDDEYRKKLIDFGYLKLGRKFKPILRYMDPAEYNDFLKTIDIGFFNNNRQQAMGNINRLLLTGAKVYLRKETSMWNHYISKGFNIFAIEDLTESFDRFIEYDVEKMKHNTEIFDKKCGTLYAENQWNRVLNNISTKRN